MEIREAYKIGLAEYVFSGSIFEQIIDGAPHLELDKIHIVSDEYTNFFEINSNRKNALTNFLITDDEVLNYYKNDIIEVLNVVTDKCIKAIEADHKAKLMLGGVRRAVQKIQLDKLDRAHTAIMVYEEQLDNFVPVKLYIFYVVETIMFDDALLPSIQEMFPYKDPLLKEEPQEEAQND